jgi:hypothetical protein
VEARPVKWFIINTEAFSPPGVKGQEQLSFALFPKAFRRFLEVHPDPFIILDEASAIKTTQAMKEEKKSTRTRLIKLLNKTGERCILTATLLSKSPLNAVDPYNFLADGFFPESMYALAEKYCLMIPLRTHRGRRIVMSEDLYYDLRKWLKNSWIRGGEAVLMKCMEKITEEYGLTREKIEWIITHQQYSPYLNQRALMRRLAPCTMFVKREDVFDITYDKFVKEPILRPVTLPPETMKLANALVKRGFTDRYTLGHAEALDLLLRLQDLCNGFEPIEETDAGDRVITHRALPSNPKMEELFALLDEINLDENQVVVWCSRILLLEAVAKEMAARGISCVSYYGGCGDKEKEEAERTFLARGAKVFLANQASGAFGLNCLARASYGIYLCLDNSAEKYYQSLHRLLRGELDAPKFCYIIYAEGSVEEKQIRSLNRGQDLIGARNEPDVFMFTA